MNNAIQNVTFVSCFCKNKKYFFSFFFKHRIDYMGVWICDGSVVQYEIYDKGAFFSNELSEQQKEVIGELLKNPDLYLFK